MSPKEKHIPDNAQRTSICLTAEDRAAIWWISQVRRRQKSKRTTTNDILVDALWYFLERTEQKTKEQMQALLPSVAEEEERERPSAKVTQMPKPKKK